MAGEAGIGKTRLLAAIAAEAAGRSFGTVRAAAFPGDTETFGGLLLDLEHILTKLGAARRTEIAAWVTGLGRRAEGSG